MGASYKQVPTIMLKGKWLEDAGFNAGEYVEVICEGDRITLAKTTPPEAKTSSKQSLEEKINGMSESQRRRLAKMIDKM